ncbi:hypothetical protein SAMN05216404_112111 [Nitrosospira multiformis]|uniref:Uncharacterized protein n=1 Tax=Nitrosospira multiformis TaxID=1231 RepID=A0A1H8MF87_9PROT|nr:hypothetical protein SAMN05216404_112111 [Nitrosospira multiformis]
MGLWLVEDSQDFVGNRSIAATFVVFQLEPVVPPTLFGSAFLGFHIKGPATLTLVPSV